MEKIRREQGVGKRGIDRNIKKKNIRDRKREQTRKNRRIKIYNRVYKKIVTAGIPEHLKGKRNRKEKNIIAKYLRCKRKKILG